MRSRERGVNVWKRRAGVIRRVQELSKTPWKTSFSINDSGRGSNLCTISLRSSQSCLVKETIPEMQSRHHFQVRNKLIYC
jgi:hypothetical protein